VLAFPFEVAAWDRWQREKRSRLLAKAYDLGCMNNVQLAEAFERLEHRILTLEHEVERLKEEG
jgi:hypothetical protein